MNGRIYLVTFRDDETGEIVVSHGYDLAAGKNVILSCDPLREYKRRGAKWDPEENGWFVDEDFARRPDVMVSGPRPVPPRPIVRPGPPRQLRP